MPKTTLTGESLQKELTVAKRSRQTELLEMPFKTLEGSGEYLPPKLGALFSIGHDEHSVSGKSDRSKSSKRKVASWRRFKQEPKGALTDAGIESPRATQDEGDSNVKRKAGDDREASSKMLKQSEGLMVHQKPPTPQ